MLGLCDEYGRRTVQNPFPPWHLVPNENPTAGAIRYPAIPPPLGSTLYLNAVHPPPVRDGQIVERKFNGMLPDRLPIDKIGVVVGQIEQEGTGTTIGLADPRRQQKVKPQQLMGRYLRCSESDPRRLLGRVAASCEGRKMPNIRQRVTRGAVRGGSAAAVNVGLSYLVGGGFNPYATGILIGTSILDSLLSTDPPPPPPTRQQILFGKDTYKQWVFGYGPLPVRTQYGGSFRREGVSGLPDKWLAAIQTATNAGALTIAKNQLEDLQGWSICDLIVYLSHGNMNSGGIRGIFIDDQYISLTSNAFSNYTTPATPLLYPTGYPIGGNPVTDNYTGKLLLTPALSGALPTDTALNSIALGTAYAAVRNGISWNNEWVNGIGEYNNTAWARISLVEPLLPGKTFWTDREFPSRISLLAEGIEVFDLSQYPNHRTAAKVWTDNAISIRYYVETEIIGTPEAEIDMASVLESYNYAEDVITYDFAKYREGRAAITNGQDSATYTGRLPRRGRRYAFNGIIGSDQPDIRRIRDRLDFAANGRTVPSGSGMAILAGHPRAATSVFFKDEDYVENPERVVQPDVDRSFNAIRVRYKSQMFGFAEREIIIRDQDAVDRDGREILRRGTLVIEDAPNDLAVHARTVAELIEHRNDRIISLVVIGIHNDVRIGDAVTVSSTALEVNEKKYYVANRELNFNEDTTKFLCAQRAMR